MDEAAFRRIVSGENRRIAAACARGGLRFLSLFYALGVRARNLAFDRGFRKVHRAAVPVVSVGNVTTGGTGKTPFVGWLANWCQRHGLRPAILSRGYRALPGAANDEKLVLDQLCPGVPHLQDADRVASAETAVRQHGAQVLILDDGFQHRGLARDLDIVLIDALCPWGYGHLLPRGLLREPLSALRRADLIVLTRAEQCRPEAKAKLVERLGDLRGRADHVEISFRPQSLVNSDKETEAPSSLNGRRVAAFCGIGNPHAFRKTIADCGLRVEDAGFRSFPDHHHYSGADAAELGRWVERQAAAAVLTTQKDLVKVNRSRLGGRPLWAVRIEIEITAGGELLDRALGRTVAGR